MIAEKINLMTPERVVQRYTFDERFYEIQRPTDNGIQTLFYPSVTTILGDVRVGGGLDNWKADQASRLGVEGAKFDMWLRAQRGSRVHDAINRYNKGESLTWFDAQGRTLFDDLEWKAICRYVQWFDETKPTILATEMTVFSHMWGYAGTLDALMEIDGKIHVVDFKTSKQIVSEHMLQVAAYLDAVNEMFPQLEVEGATVLLLGAQTKRGWQMRTMIEPEELSGMLGRFWNRLRVFKDEHSDFQPKRDLLPTELVPFHATRTAQ